MSKYIVVIPDGVEWGVVTCRTEDGFYTRDFDSLEELNSDYINENFGQLQETAYQKGFEDGKEASMGTLSKGCDGCKYVAKDSNEQPCKRCCNSHPCLWTKDGYAYDYIRNGIQNMIDTLHIGADEISKVLEEMKE